nr:SGNH/GDSL hydrolase N-terminal domain-containing protein [Bacteroidales bacterium]
MRRVFIAMFLALIPVLVWGQKASDLVYTDARELMLINQGFDNTELYYSRLPLDMKDAIRKAVWDLGLNSAGLAIRFSTNAKAIGARWTLLNNFNMANMAGTG